MKEPKSINILSIESSSSVCSVCISRDEHLISEYNIFEKNLHDRLLADLIKRVLRDIELPLKEIDAVAVSAGPGSFTGLRIGFSIAKGICYDQKIRLIAIPTLKAIANEQIEIAKFNSKDFILPVIFSNENQYYTQMFDLTLQEISVVKIMKKEEIESIEGENFLLAGTSAKDFITDIPEVCTKLTASTIAKLALKYYYDSIFVNPFELTPDYYQLFKIK